MTALSLSKEQPMLAEAGMTPEVISGGLMGMVGAVILLLLKDTIPRIIEYFNGRNAERAMSRKEEIARLVLTAASVEKRLSDCEDDREELHTKATEQAVQIATLQHEVQRLSNKVD